jgi:hypothetical protein
MNNVKHGLGEMVYIVKEDPESGKKSGGGKYFGIFYNLH